MAVVIFDSVTQRCGVSSMHGEAYSILAVACSVVIDMMSQGLAVQP